MQLVVAHECPKMHLLCGAGKLFQLCLIFFVFSKLFLKALLALDNIEAVIAAVKFGFALVNLNTALRNLIKEISVMAYGEYSALKVEEILLEPFGGPQGARSPGGIGCL